MATAATASSLASADVCWPVRVQEFARRYDQRIEASCKVLQGFSATANTATELVLPADILQACKQRLCSCLATYISVRYWLLYAAGDRAITGSMQRYSTATAAAASYPAACAPGHVSSDPRPGLCRDTRELVAGPTYLLYSAASRTLKYKQASPSLIAVFSTSIAHRAAWQSVSNAISRPCWLHHTANTQECARLVSGSHLQT
jgi:hypothetical protein